MPPRPCARFPDRAPLALRLTLPALLAGTLLTGCEDFSARVPGPPAPAPTPTIEARFRPAAGFWSGQAASGPWCAPAPAARPATWHTAAASWTPSAAQGLRGFEGLDPEQRRELALIPTDGDHAALRAWAVKRGATVLGQSGSFVLVRAWPDLGPAALQEGQARYAEVLGRPGTPTQSPASEPPAPAPAPAVQSLALPSPLESGDPATEGYFSMTNVRGAWALLEQGCAPIVTAVIDTGWSSDPWGHEHNLTPRTSWFNAVSGEQGQASSQVSPELGRDHGAMVGSVIAQTVNGEGPGYSLGYNLVKVLPINAQVQSGTHAGELDPAAISLGIDYAIGQAITARGPVINPFPAQIINLSLGAPGAGSAEESALLAEQASRAAAAGIVMVAAAGNSGEDELYNYALAEPTIAVAGLNRQGGRWTQAPAGTGPGAVTPGSNTGQELDMAAPAEAVPLTFDRRLSTQTGTSFAAPWASAQIALWMYQNRHLTGDHARGLRGAALYSALRRCLTRAGTQPHDRQLGVGAVDTAVLVGPAPECRN